MTWLIKIEVERFEDAQKLVKAIESLHMIDIDIPIVDIEYEELNDDV
jgi:hypothetical protein